MSSEMEPDKYNQQEALSYAGYAEYSANSSAQHAANMEELIAEFPSNEEMDLLRRLNKEDERWEIINLIVTILGVLIIILGLFASFVNPYVGIAAIIGGFITDCIPILSSRPREASWKRLNSVRQQNFLEHLIETSSGELQVHALKSYIQLKPENEEKSR